MALLERHAIPCWPPDVVAFVTADVSSLGGAAAVVAACRAAGVEVADGEAMGLPGAIRIGVPSSALGEAIERLDAAFAELKGR